MRAKEFIIVEYRDRLFQYVKSLLPTWPDYVLKDWLVPNKGNFSNLPTDAVKNGIMEKVQGAGLTADSKWQLIPDMKFTMDMFDPKTKQLLIGRAGGSSDLGMGIPKDKERHATQAVLAQQQGGVRKEPVLLIKMSNGYELLEGWHRTIQHFVKYPDGYVGPAYVVVAEGQPGVAEGLEHADKLSGLVDLPVFPSSTNPRGTAKVVNTGDRIMAVLNVRGVNIPYYISTGGGGKASVPTGKWYPIFGRHSSGWLNKGGEDSINKSYGSNVLALGSSRLNNMLGDLSSMESQIPFMKKSGDAIINRDLQPMSYSEVSANPDEFKKRVNSFLAKLGSPPFYKVNATETQGVAENMDHSKDSQAVPELKAALLAKKQKLQAATDDQVYDIIDSIMTRIAKSHGMSGQKLHDMWVKEYNQIPDTWIMK